MSLVGVAGRRRNGLAATVAACVLLCLSQIASAQVAKPASFRTINISTEPNAVIWLDNIRYGKADESGRFTIKRVTAGAHTLRVRADGYKESTKPIAATQSGEVVVTLLKTTDIAELTLQEAERLATQDRQKAIAAYKKAISIKSTYVEAHIGLARIYSESSDYENALKAIRDARRVKPGVAELSAIEGRVYKDSGDEAKAIVAFRRAITEGRGFQPEAYTGLGMLYKDRAEAAAGEVDLAGEQANYNEAVKNFSTAVKQLGGSPDASVVFQLLGLVYEKQKKYREAISLYENYLRAFPDSPDAPTIRSFIVQLQKQMAEQP